MLMLQVLGFEIDAVNSVQFSNHTGKKIFILWKYSLNKYYYQTHILFAWVLNGISSHQYDSIRTRNQPPPFWFSSSHDGFGIKMLAILSPLHLAFPVIAQHSI